MSVSYGKEYYDTSYLKEVLFGLHAEHGTPETAMSCTACIIAALDKVEAENYSRRFGDGSGR